MSKRKTVIGRLALAFAALLTVLAVSGPTRADDDWRRWGRDNDRHWSDNDGRRDHDNRRDWGHGNGGWGNNWNNNRRHSNNGWGNNGWGNNGWGNNGWGNNWRGNDHYPRYVYVRPRPYYYPQPYYYDYYARPSFNFVIPLHID